MVRVVVGLVLVAAGAVMLAGAAGGPDGAVRFASRWWPAAAAVLVVAHALTFVGPAVRRGSGVALPLAVLGALLAAAVGALLVTTGRVPGGPPGLLPGAGLVAAGAVLAAAQPSPDRRFQTWVSVSAVLRRARLSSAGRGVRLVSVRALLGQAVVDLTGATLEPGGTEVHATVLGGSVVLVLPAGWEVVPDGREDGSVKVSVPAADAALPRVPEERVPLSVNGFRGRLHVEWRAAPGHLLAPPPPAGPATGGGS